MIDLTNAAADIQNFIEDKGWEFYFIGGLTVQVWGQPRLTRDIDLTIFTNLVDETKYISAFLERYKPKFHDAEKFALTNRVLPMFTETGIGIDVTLSGISDGSQALDRSSYQPYTESINLRICSPDDLIIMKTVAARPQDWMDIESVIIRQDHLDWPYIECTLEGLTAYEDMTDRLNRLANLKSVFYRK